MFTASERSEHAGTLAHDTSERWGALDGLRGLAILLMIVDHLVALAGGPWWIREVVTRPALPMFMLASGYCYRGRWGPRQWEVLAAAGLSWPLAHFLGLALVPVLVVYAAVMPLFPLVARWPWVGIGLAVLQPTTWPLEWGGYEPGLLLGLVGVGQVLQRLSPPRLPQWLEVFAVPGRYPLLVYVGHLAFLAGLVFVSQV